MIVHNDSRQTVVLYEFESPKSYFMFLCGTDYDCTLSVERVKDDVPKSVIRTSSVLRSWYSVNLGFLDLCVCVGLVRVLPCCIVGFLPLRCVIIIICYGKRGTDILNYEI